MLPQSLLEKYTRLQNNIAAMGRVVIAYSGGVDSTLLLRIGTELLGENCIGVIGISPSLARTELDEALATARSFSGRIVQIETNELDNPDYVSNTNMRCFHCKHELFSTLLEFARTERINYILDGNNFDDLGDYRPGMNAAKQLNVRSPFLEAEMGKTDIRELARYLRLPNWDKPAQPCLSSRMAYGQRIDIQVLDKIAAAESFLKEQGFKIVRVRYRGEYTSVEVGPDELDRLFDLRRQKQIRERLQELGLPSVEFDKDGYRSGKLNQNLATG